MKYLSQALIIAAVTFAAELIHHFVPLPIPASIYGLVILFFLLKSGLLKLEQIRDVGELLLDLLPLLLLPATVRLVTVMDDLASMIVPVLLASTAGTVFVLFVTGRVAQRVMRGKKGEQDG